MLDTQRILSDGLLRRFAERPASYDEENHFSQEDFDDLRQAGYLTMPVPRELGGPGLTLAEVCQEQRRLAYYAPATALGVNMHLYWVGLVADLWRQGDRSNEWLLREAMEGEVFNAGHSERGNDLTALLSTSRAERVDSGFRIAGHKMFGSLMPVWTRIGLHATWADAEGGTKIVHAFLPRSSNGYHIVDTWDTTGKGAMRSDDTLLEGVFIPDKYIARIVPAGCVDAFVLGIFTWALLGIGNIYCGVARRAIDLAVPADTGKTSLALIQMMANHPELRQMVAEMILAFEPIAPHLDRAAAEWSEGIDHDATWPAKIVSAKHHAVEACWWIVDRAMEVSGRTDMFHANELERLFRDARTCQRWTITTSPAKSGIHLGEPPPRPSVGSGSGRAIAGGEAFCAGATTLRYHSE